MKILLLLELVEELGLNWRYSLQKLVIKYWPFLETFQALLSNENISCLSVDLSNESELNKVNEFLAKSWKQVDAVIHNAGSLLLKPF
jgi:enoyl-[acyl-carrier-protein] reductase (NADH)